MQNVKRIHIIEDFDEIKFEEEINEYLQKGKGIYSVDVNINVLKDDEKLDVVLYTAIIKELSVL